jgi:alpha-L-arabinofuranosidase
MFKFGLSDHMLRLSLLSLTILSVGCSGGGSSSSSAPAITVPAKLFGANLSWNILGNGIVDGGELIRDRSFRQGSTLWLPVLNGGTVSFNASGGDSSPAGGNAIAGSTTLTRSSAGYTCVYQQLLADLESSATYALNFSSNAASGTQTLYAFLVDGSYGTLAQQSLSSSNGWQQHALTLSPSASTNPALLGICLSTAGSVDIDEVRLSKATTPAIKTAVKSQLTNLGVKSLRWPGGTLLDTFDWKLSVGPVLSRGEQIAEANYETPALGLHEFLNLCEELNIVPLVGVNVLDTSQSAADLVEYITGSGSTTQGALRVANGRNLPWTNVRYFEIGNEPSTSYKGVGLADNAGTNYVSLARPIITAMRAKASSLGVTIETSAVSEASFQLADWLAAGTTSTVRLLKNWNGQTFASGTGLTSDTQFVHGHFYANFAPYSSISDYRALMGSGALLTRTLNEKIAPLTGSLPIWITEYQVAVESSGSIQPAYTLDYQSGLIVADMLMSMIEQRVPAAHLFNLSQENVYGMLKPSSNFGWRPAAWAFSIFSPLAGETKLDLTMTSTGVLTSDTYTVPTGSGNIPSNLSYRKLSGVATRNASTGKPRVIVLNRDDTTDAMVTLAVPGYTLSSATIYRYQNASLSANNETAGNTVTVTSQAVSAATPFQLNVPKYSLVRVDFN